MRIISSQINGTVDHQSKQNSGELEVIKSRQSQTSLDGNQRVIGSKETINLSYSQTYESEQSSRLYSQSLISDTHNNSQQELTQEEITHSLVSGILQHNVHISDVIFSNAFPISGQAGLQINSGLGESESSTIFDEFGLTEELSQQEASSLRVQSNSSNDLVDSSEISVTQQVVFQEEESLTLVSEGEITIADGRSINFRLELDLDSKYTEVTEQSLNVRSEEFVDPLVISLDRRAPSLTNSTFMFDIDSDGESDKLSQLAPGAGFLAFDQNKDGIINNGSELFGPQSGNSYNDLSVYDGNNDGWIDESDAIFEQLLVWQPNHHSEGNSLQSLKDAGIGAISLQSIESPFTLKDEQNNTLGMVQRSGIYVKENGEVGLVQQIDLAVRQKITDEDPLATMFYEQASKLEQQFQQYVSNNQAQMFERAEMEFEALNLNIASFDIEALRLDLNRDVEEIEFETESLPMMIIAKHFAIESEFQARSSRQHDSFQSSSFKQLDNTKTELNSSQAGDSEIANPSNNSIFRVFSHHDMPNSNDAIRRDETQSSNKSKIIEEVLRPLHEQLKQKRQQASEAYLKS